MNSTTSPWSIVGHTSAVHRLARAIEARHIAHAYLFSGPESVGKQTMARAFAQALLCTSEEARPCRTCRACHLVDASHHPDFIVLDMEWQALNLPQKGGGQSISVDTVRAIGSELARRPHEAPWKVLLVPDVDQFTTAASNAFLKTLEEPPSSVVILLTAPDPELVLPTIRSRCQPVPLLALPIRLVENALIEQWSVAHERARLLARVSEGRIGWAIRAAEDDRLLQARAASLEALQKALQSNRAERLLSAATLSKSNDMEVMRTWASWWRDVLLLHNGAEGAIANIDQRQSLQAAVGHYTVEQAHSFLRALQKVLRLGKESNANTQLLWEVLLLKLPYGARG